MNKKLLLTSALCGSVMLSGAALSETKITGGMVLSYLANSAATKAASNNGMGRETQINISNSGDLNNGMKYAAGFALEFDGADTGASVSNENVYIDIISGNTTASFGVDHAPNISTSAAPRVAEDMDNLMAQLGADKVSYEYAPGTGIDQSFQVALIQKGVAGGTLSAGFIPKTGDAGGNDNSIDTSAENSAMQIIYSGNLGVDGLTVKAAYAKVDAPTTDKRDEKIIQYGAAYNFGKFAIGAHVNDEETATIGTDHKSYEFGATAAITDKFSVGLTYIETDINTATKVDEEITVVQLGYNLGPVALTASYAQVENSLGSASAADQELMSIRASAKF